MTAKLLDRLTLAAGTWMLAGGFWDGWAHRRELPDTFWTIWHLAIYSGFAALAATILGAVAWSRPSAGTWRTAIPPGYGWAVAGVPLFALGAIGDALWHTLFGIEASTDALFSPSHLTLGAAAVLMITAPFRADAHRLAESSSVGRGWPRMLSLILLFAQLQFFTQFAGPYAGVIGGGLRGSYDILEREFLGAYLFAALLVGILLVALRRPPLPLGALTLMLGGTSTAVVLMVGDRPMHLQLTQIGIAVAAGVFGDALLLRLRPSYQRVGALRAVTFAVPASFFAIYLFVVIVRVGTWYTVHAITGLVLVSGIVGLLLSYVVVPPKVVGEPGAA